MCTRCSSLAVASHDKQASASPVSRLAGLPGLLTRRLIGAPAPCFLPRSCGLFPLLANAAMSVRPVLLGLYEKYFLPLQKLLLPSLQAFIIGLLPGLEEGSEIYDRWVSAGAAGSAAPAAPGRVGPAACVYVTAL